MIYIIEGAELDQLTAELIRRSGSGPYALRVEPRSEGVSVRVDGGQWSTIGRPESFDPKLCPNPWHATSKARAEMSCPECPADGAQPDQRIYGITGDELGKLLAVATGRPWSGPYPVRLEPCPEGMEYKVDAQVENVRGDNLLKHLSWLRDEAAKWERMAAGSEDPNSKREYLSCATVLREAYTGMSNILMNAP